MRAVDTSAKRKLGKRIALAGITGLFVIGAAIAIWIWHRVEDSSHPQADVAVPVHIVAVTVENVPIHVSGLGTVQSSNTVTITSRVDGELDKVLFNEGQDVKQRLTKQKQKSNRMRRPLPMPG
jgi:membrane fusion protein, multidrug efflux system